MEKQTNKHSIKWCNWSVHLPPDGEKFNGLLPTWVCRRCNIDDGFDASLADDDRFLVMGPNSSRLRTVDIALQFQRKSCTVQRIEFDEMAERPICGLWPVVVA